MSEAQGRLRPPVGPADHAQGLADAPVTLVEYGDYECPHCGAAAPVVRAVQRRLGKRLRFVYRNFPLTEIDPHAEHAAEAAEAAGAQGKFWEMHEALFARQSRLDDDGLRRDAELVGLDLARFARDLADHRFADRVQADFLSGVRSGVNGTPTFFINGTRYDDTWDEETLVAALAAVAG